MKPYESYNEINIPWLNIIPSHWKLLRNKNVLIEKKDVVGNKSSDYTLLSLTLNGVIKRDLINAKGKFPKDFDTYKIVSEKDIIFCLFDVDETPRTVGLSSFNGMITGAYDVFSIKNINEKYLYYYYLSVDNSKSMKPLYTGLRKVIGLPTFLGTKLPVPPRLEQDQIVRYLDWMLSKINKLIKAKKKQIMLLNEQKQAIINKTVTKGLDDSVAMKDSAIEWLGQVPKDWDVLFLFQTATEQSIPNKTIKNQNLLSLSYGKIVNKDINTTDGLLPASFDTYQVVNDGNIILRLTDLQNDHKSLRVGLVTQTGIITSAYTCLLPRENIVPQYLYLLLHSFDICKVFYGMGGGVRQSIGYKDISKLTVLCPPIDEQREIVEYCYNLVNKLESFILSENNFITLLEEYKSSLISNVVTGKVDVRDVVIPDFETEDEPIEEEMSDEETEDIEEAEADF